MAVEVLEQRLALTSFLQQFPSLIALGGSVSSDDQFGNAVAMDGNQAVVGAYLHDEGGTNAGAAFVFEKENGTWVQQAKLLASDAEGNAHFGLSVAIDGDTILAGAPAHDGVASNTGTVAVFEGEKSTTVEEDVAILSARLADFTEVEFAYIASISSDVGLYRSSDEMFDPSDI